MAKHGWVVAGLIAVALSWPGKAVSQTASPESLAAAKELMIAVKMSDQVKLMLPAIMEQLRPLIVKGSPERERDFDAFMPIMMQVMNAKMEEFLNLNAQIYARHFTADEMRQVSNFYRTPAGDKFLQKQPEVFREATALGQQFGQDIARIAYDRMVEELRKRGHSL